MRRHAFYDAPLMICRRHDYIAALLRLLIVDAVPPRLLDAACLRAPHAAIIYAIIDVTLLSSMVAFLR